MPSSPSSSSSLESARSRVRRRPERAAYDRDAVFAVVDAALSCHVGVVRDGWPVVIPTIHARIDETIYLHGSPGAGYVRDGRQGEPVCVTFTVVDGLVLSRSARNHSLNYRSAVVFGRAERVGDPTEKLAALEAITDHIVPGRWDEVRRPNAAELREVEVLAVTVSDGSAKTRAGPPREDADGDEGVWAGVIPLVTVRGEPQPAPFVAAGGPAPRW